MTFLDIENCFNIEYNYYSKIPIYSTNLRRIEMKKVICKVEYDTDRAVLVGKVANGTWGDPKGFEETLYKTAQSVYQIHF